MNQECRMSLQSLKGLLGLELHRRTLFTRGESAHALRGISRRQDAVLFFSMQALYRSFSSQRDGGSSWNIFFQRNHTQKKIFFTMLQYSLSWVPGYCKRPVRWQLTLIGSRTCTFFHVTSAWFRDYSCAILLFFHKIALFWKDLVTKIK